MFVCDSGELTTAQRVSELLKGLMDSNVKAVLQNFIFSCSLSREVIVFSAVVGSHPMTEESFMVSLLWRCSFAYRQYFMVTSCLNICTVSTPPVNKYTAHRGEGLT